jgi:hypothetical protein
MTNADASFSGQKKELELGVKGDRLAWRLTQIPLLVVMSLLAMTLAGIAAWGLYVSVAALADGGVAADLKNASQVFVGGSSSILGFVVIRLFGLLTREIGKYVNVEREFTTMIGRLTVAEDLAKLDAALDSYPMKQG